MVTKMQKVLNSLQTSQSLAVKFLAMEIKKGGFRKKCWFLSSNFMKHRRNIHRSVWKLLACWSNSKWRYHGNRDTKIMGWGDVRYYFAMAILVIIILLLSFFRQKFVRHISRRCLDQTLWNLAGISYAMWSCSLRVDVFQNGCRCHGNGQNDKKLKNTNDHSRLLA